ncbi:non-ribosomal peptide synthetase [Fusarium circinatum]|uniref:Non-ribosomal peptide synthetase n=1 Tax=Fusarium circinatum TaxID=48490 RepID=A0A8H5UJV6_FUSCI|nr:non-ribosomal peptide synthetase [Fusarium circinatum]
MAAIVSCGCVRTADQSVPDLKPAMFPQFDLSETGSEHLEYAGRIYHVAPDDLRDTCSALWAAWAILLGCFTGLDDVCFGFESEHSVTETSGHAERMRQAVHFRLPANQRIKEILTGKFSSLVQMSDDKAETLFNTILSIQSFDHDASKDMGKVPSWCKIRMMVDPVTLQTLLTWDPSFMGRDQAENVSSTLDKILREIIKNPETLLSKISFFSERNERQVLAWNSNSMRDVHKCIHQAVSMQGALRPDAEAVCAWDGSLSYQQVLSLADHLAIRLQASGVGPEVFVPICFDKSKWVVVSMLAVLKAGGIFVPLDPSQPLLRLQALAQKVDAKTILCSPHHQRMLESVAPELIPVDEQLFTQLPEQSDEIDCGSWRNGAYMIFTSGTTGEPKGALIEHRALMSSALAHGPAMMMDSNTRSFQFAASTFDVSITEILTCMILGGCVCIPSEDARLNAVEEAITQLRANWALLTPTFVKFINPANVPTLKTLVTGGEAMTQAVIRSWSHINLINCYGPAETSVVSHVHRGMVQGTNPLNIGHQVGINCWIVDRDNPDRLMPVGAVGELVIEGHTLAREYYKEPEKTREAFIEDPLWAKNQSSRTSVRRMYKTGDLVKYNHDGTFHIAGRKDAQIKFHGQRIELGEIEHHINVSASIKHGMVVLPREGFCNGRLLAIVQLCDAIGEDLMPNGQPYKLIEGELESIAQDKIAEAKDLLGERLPSYMIPSMWLAVEFIPRLQSGKLDRKQTAKWIDNMSETLYRQLNPATAVTQLSEDLKCEREVELELHKIWAYVLNLKDEQLGFTQSFLSVGGDSISAMQVMSECKKRGLGLAVSHIINCKSIRALALQVKDIERPALLHEMVEEPFDLSPIQKLYFARPNYDQGHYNQSFLLRTSQRIDQADLRKAMETLILRHSMLRARFQQDVNGEWQQRITNDVTSSYRLRALELTSKKEIDDSLVDSQTCLDPVQGPLVAADLIDRGTEDQILFVVAHHLVIDLVSWRIILQELEEILLRPEAVQDADRPLPFQVWCRMQSEHAQAQTPDQALPIQGIPDGDAEYWGMTDIPNVYGQMVRQGFEIGPQQTSLVSKCHESLRTEIPDVLMAAMVYSFGQIFTDRPIPAIFAEGHGREVWDTSIDLSNVVGWFTTIYPVFAGSNSQSSLIDTVKMIKDSRRKVPDNGRPYFASRWLTKDGREAFSRHWPLEITFNYLGQYQQLEREGALFTPESNIAGEIREASQGADVGPLTACISLFEVSAVIVKGSLRFSFGFNQNMKHQPQIREWISCCEQSLGQVITSLASMVPEPTLSDFPLLSLTYDRLRVFTEEKLPEAGITDISLIEDAYPCSPMQSGLLVSTTRENAAYAAYTLHEVKSKSGETVDVEKLIAAWKCMVQYHAILRTVFLESVTLEDSIYDQVVLKEVKVPFTVSEIVTDKDAVAALKVPMNHGDNASRLLHHFHVCQAKSGKVFCRLDISHVIMDGTSLSILFHDLALAYQGLLKTETGPLYRDYIEALQGQPVQPGIDYWKSYLAGIEPCLFPVLDDGEIAEAKELRHLRVRFAELADLQSLCERQGVTIVNAIYAAWAVTLRLYTASDEVCFGYLTSARDLPIEGIRDTVGPIINMVTCRVNVNSTTNLGDIMTSVQRDYLESLEYRHTPLAQVHHALQLSDAVLFNTALSYRKLPPTLQTDLVFEECCPTYDPDEYNVSVNIEAGEHDMAIDLMYWSDTLSDGQAANVASTFTKALSNILHRSNEPIHQLDHLGSWHRNQISHWNQRIPDAIEKCVHDLFKQQVASRPDSPAIVSWDIHFTYAELDAASNKLAHHIVSLGVGLETFVMVCFEKSSFAIVSMLAVLKAGGLCVPLDPAHPEAAHRLRVDDTGATIALVSPSLVAKLSSIVKTVVAVDTDLLQTISAAPEPPLPQVTPANACFVIYTSGSTGRPKGVVLEHRGIASNAMHSGPKLGYGPDSRVLQFASYTFDNSLAEIFSTISLGGCVCVPSDHERLNDLTGAINRYSVTLADITPTVACFLEPSEVPTLKTLALGGEAVTAKCVGIWRDFVSLTCCYGPSECSVNSTFSGDIAQPGKANNIGRAIGSVAWVVDATDHNLLVPIGCVGELLIDGPIVSRGYLNLPDKMAQSFVPPPACIKGMTENAGSDRKLYKTGDLVRYNSDGTLTYLGRKDTQVKLNGQRIELGEIEYHIEENLPKGWESAVELITSQGRKLLACFICADADVSLRETSDDSMVLDMDDIFRSHAKKLEIVLFNAVPAYMVPSAWLPVSKMPLTSSGKLSRRSLRVLGDSVPAAKMKLYKLALKSGRAPSSEIEKQLASMWAQLLNIDVASIGVQDHFFKLGGDSIGAMQLVTLARCSNIDLTVAGVFQKPSLLDMADSAVPLSKAPSTTYRPFSLLSDECSVDTLRRVVADSAHIDVGDVQDIYPCSALQEGLMALSTKEPGAYVAQLIYRLPADIDTIRFQKAWNLVGEAEPTLRTRIVHTEDAGFVQVVVAGETPQWSAFASLSDADTIRRHLPLHNGARLTNYGLVDDASTGNYFVWTIHHSIYDGWCLPLILDKVKRCYYDDLSPTQLKGSDYSNFIKYLTDLDPQQDTNFWMSHLSNISTQHFPRLPNAEYHPSATSMMVHRATLGNTSGSEITTATRIRTAWAMAVSTYSGANDVVFWETMTGRDAPVVGIEEMAGITLATVPTRVVVEPSQTVAALLASVQDHSAAVRRHQFVGIQSIRNISADTALACGAQNLLAINYGPRESTDAFWCEQSNEMAGTNFYSSYPLMLSCHFADGELETVVHFDPNVVPEALMQRIMDHFALMLESVSSSDLLDEKLRDIPLLSDGDLQTLRDMNRTLPSASGHLIHDAVRAQTLAQPRDKLAVVSWDQSLTYADLDTQSTSLAAVLVANGVSVHSIVPFCMDKSSLVVVSILAILKSGAAFVPLDPAHPDARIQGIVTDTRATVILSSDQHAERLTMLGSQVISVSQALANGGTQGQDDLTNQAPLSLSATSPAYIIFTSGTTGKPKGTIVDHSAFCTGAYEHGRAMGMTESSRVLQFASYTFDASIMEILTTLIHGGTVCVPSSDERLHDLAGSINRMNVNWALLTPSVAQLLQPSLVPSLKTLVLGGEAMSSAHISSWAPSVRLMNAYGPSETAVVAAVNPSVTLDSSPSNIGHAVGGICWVTDATNHDRLMPIGAVGELVIEGPILAQGYLNEPGRTAESFITSPKWCQHFPTATADRERRFYKTGDLVKLTEDGIEFHGRKDDQVKVNGQRIELSEIEHHLSADLAVESCLAAVPASGPFKTRLVAILSLHSITTNNGDEEMRIMPKYPPSLLVGIREGLAKHLASYMIPSLWIVVDYIPLLPSGKLDRRRTFRWVEDMSLEQYQLVLDAQEDASALDRDASEVEIKLRAAWAKALNLKVDMVPFKQSFIHLGGDSISAMKLMAICRSSDMAVSISQIMRAKSIIDLASVVTNVKEVMYDKEQLEKPFKLSAIQKVYFQSIGLGSHHFNQSMTLATTRYISSQELSDALRSIVKMHSMMRARFSQAEGKWTQRVTSDVAGSYALRSHGIVDTKRLLELVAESQTTLDIVHGPILAVDLFEMEGTGNQIVTFVAHHLIVDVVSWNILLQDLEGLLSASAYSPSKSLSFQTWISKQHDETRKTSLAHVFHDIAALLSDLGYWGMEGVPNIHGDSVTETMTIPNDTSVLLSGSDHDVVDVLLASLLASFRQTFPDRSMPPIFNEGHGREPPDDSLDLSRTVGWFTTLCPVFFPEIVPTEYDILDVVCWVRDFRKKLPGNGRPYFAHSMLSDSKSQIEFPVEIAFNFLGHTRDVGTGDSVFKAVDGSMLDSLSSQFDIGADIPRLALIEISASFTNEGLVFDFSFNRHMEPQGLSQAIREPSPDLFLLPLAFKMETQVTQALAEVGISPDNVEAVYPCSSVQQGILLSQIKDPEYYSYSITFSVTSTRSGDSIDAQRLSEAWKRVVHRHSTLRTAFVDSILQEGAISQVVLRNHDASISIIECPSTEVDNRLGDYSPLGLPTNQPPHRFTIFNTAEGTVQCVLEMSHAISDGTSMPILFHDLGQAYEGSLDTTNLTVYRDYVSFLQRSGGYQDAKYWKTYLDGAEPCCLPLLTDGTTAPRSLRTLTQGISHAAELQALCAERGITLSNLLQLAWALVLQAYTGLDDVCFGYLVADRDVTVSGIDEAIGVFISMLVCRVRLDPSTSLDNALRTIQQDIATAMNHKNVSLANFQHAVGISNEPLFNTAYSFQRRSVSKDMATGALSFDVRDAQDPSEYDMTVNVEVWDSNVELQLCYWQDRVSDAHAASIASTLDQVLSSMVRCDTAVPIGELDILSDHGRQMLMSWNNNEPVVLNDCVHHVFEHNCQRLPDHTPAIDAWDATFTYPELDAAASRFAQYLVFLGIGPETYVPLCFEKSAWTVVAMMAVLKAGGAFVPLDPTHPPDRIKFLVSNVNAKLIICSTSLKAKFDSLGLYAVPLGKETMSLLPLVLPDSPRVTARPDNAAYIIFTSGTTGVPKGTIIEHASFTTGGTSHAKAIMMTPSSRVLQFASHTFDASVMEILSTLLVGGCICIPNDQDRMNDLSGVITKFNVNWTLLTPSVANVLKPGSLPTLRVLVTGGEAMSRDHITKWAGHAALVNAYGPSETSVIAATSTKVDHDGNIINNDPGTIGHAVGSRCWVVDTRNHNRLMPIGGIGELLVEGPIVARGYLDNEAKTKEAFIEPPSWRAGMSLEGDDIARMYKTGDLVMYNSDGSLKYVSRKDTQIKLNGQRIELGEIEYHVQAHLPDYIQAAVEIVVPQSKTSTKALAVFFTSDDDVEDTSTQDVDPILAKMSSPSTDLAQTLKSALKDALPSYMVPTIYIPLSKMPLTLAGKLDRQRLKAIARSVPTHLMASYKLSGLSRSGNIPTTAMQRKLQKAWATVLNIPIDQINIDDSFFRLGGDSVDAMKLVPAARSEGLVIAVMGIFSNPVLLDMAMSCKQSDETRVSIVDPFSLLSDIEDSSMLLHEIAGRCNVQESQILDIYPCSPLQDGLVASTLQQPGAYVATYVFQLPFDISMERFKLAWQKTVDRVEILRTRIVNTSLKSYQAVLAPHGIEWEHHDDLESATAKAGSVPDHNGGVLARYSIVEAPDDGPCHFVWVVHHALYDAWSMPSLLKLVSQFYHGDTADEHAVEYANFIRYLADVDTQASDEFWRARFQDSISVTHFPKVSSAPTAQSCHESLTHTIQYSKSRLGMDITIPTIVRAAWALVLGSHTGSDDVLFGETLSGRDIALDHVQDILGPTLTTVPSRVQIDRNSTIGDLLKSLHHQATDLIPHQHAGLQRIRRLSDAISVASDFQNLLVIQSSDHETGQNDLLNPIQDDVGQRGFFTYPLVVECSIEAQELVMTIHHDNKLISSWQAERIAQQFEALVGQLTDLSLREPKHKVSQLRLYSQEDVETIKRWNSSVLEPAMQSIPDLFWQSVATKGNDIAIRAWDGQLSYKDLAQHASRLARILVQKGVHAEELVPCCMDKSLWTAVSMLAVILAGGAIVPMDPTHPSARHAEITRDCQACVVLCAPQYQERFRGLVESVLLVDSDLFTAKGLCEELSRQDLTAVAPRDAAFVIYTSGSTGKPKGVVIEHGSFVISSRAFMNRMNMSPSSAVLHFASYAFDIAMGETFAPLTCGACVCIPSEEMRMSDLAGSMTTLGVTWAFLTPSLANLQDPSKFTTLKTLVCGGEALTPETISSWGDKVELINGYGPAECTMFAVANNAVGASKDPANIGHAMDGNRTWVVDPRDHNCLVPVGCVGELLISGPIVTRGYLNDKKRTSASFIEDPAWMSLFTNESVRLYKTGDLVRYCPDGSLDYLGRKDHQVKLHGQRMELGEIEARLESDPRIRQVLVNLPQSGIFKGRLVAITSLEDPSPTEVFLTTSGFVPIPESAMETARTQICAMQHDLAATLPPYMIPSVWLAVQAIPLLLSGKLDRSSAISWLADSEADFCKVAVDLDHGQDAVDAVMTPVSQQLRRIWASILNIPETETPMNRSLISLGGDSIMAIQMLTRCHDQSLSLTLQDIMRAKGISELSTFVASQEPRVLDHYDEDDDLPFELSPIQRLFFNNSANKDRGDRFNQSQLLSINKTLEVSSLQDALDALVERHPMLRARFNKSPTGEWTQHIVSHAQDSYGFQHHELAAEPDMIPIVAASQRSIDVSGPVFAVDLLTLSHGTQVLSLVAHHLVIDIISWINIIHDLEALLISTYLPPINPVSFRRWNALQIGHINSLNNGAALLPFAVRPADMDFWGMSNTPNVYGDMEQKSFVITEADVVSSILGGSNRALKTEPLDLFITAIFKSFAQTFDSRELPTLFNESHGREPWDQTIDPSQTVGWFTSLCPLQLSRQSLEYGDQVDHVRKVKDVRRSIPNNGRPYFAHRHLTSSGSLHDGPMEILLNYLGHTQQTNHGDSLFTAVDFPFTEQDTLAISDVAPETSRLALFEISISILDEGISFTLMYNQHMLHQEGIDKWVTNCKETLMDTTRRLAETSSAPTLSDFPLLPISYTDLHEIISTHLPNAHVPFDMVEDMYPCSPMQTGILLSQLLDPSQYLFHVVLQLNLPDGSAIDTAKLVQACRQVIERHPALRTIFIDSLRQGGSFDQVVLKPFASRISTIKCREIDVMAELNSRSLGETNKRHDGPMLPYQITICETPQGKVFMKLELNHAVTDGASTSILLRDISNAYTDSLSPTPAPSYKEYIKYISSQSTASSLNFWTGYLWESQHTGFPTLSPDLVANRRLQSVAVQFYRFTELQSLGSKLGVTFSNIIMVAWALLLGAYTDRQDVCFGYLASGRDARIDVVDGIVGPLINMLVFRFQFTPETVLKTLFSTARDDYMASLPHQHFSLARVSHTLGHSKRGFFNTAVSIQNAGATSVSEPDSLTYEALNAYDPSEYAVTVNANATRGDEGILFRYWSNILSSSQAQDLAVNMSELLNNFIDHSDDTLAHLRLLQSSPVARNTYTQSSDVDGSISEHDESNHLPKAQSSGISASSTLIDVGDAASMSSNMCNSFSHDRKQLYNKLSALWRDGLEYQGCAISPTDNFFESGGDSIVAMSMVGNARDLDLPLTVADIFKNPEFGSLLDCLNDKSYKDSDRASSHDHMDTSTSKKEKHIISDQPYRPLSLLDADDAEQFVRSHVCPVIGVSRASIIDVLPTTDFQDQAIHGSLLKSRWQLNYFHLDSPGPLDMALLQEAITNVVAAYDILRAVFVSHQGRYLQVILRHVQPTVIVEDVESIDQFTSELQVAHQQEVPRPQEPSLRFIVARHKSSERHRVFIRISHAQYDGVCFPTILQTLKASLDGEPINPTPSYASYIQRVLGTNSQGCYSYWTALLKDSTPTSIVQREHTSLRTSPTQVLRKVVSTPSLASVNITTSTVIKAAWSTVLAKITGKTDVIFGNVISGRNASNIPGIQTIVGPCLNIVPVRVRQQSYWNVLDLLQHIQDQQVDNMPYETLGFREIIDKCTDWDDDGVNGFCTVVQHQSMSRTESFAMGGNMYQVGAMGSQEDCADLSIVTTPQDVDSTENSALKLPSIPLAQFHNLPRPVIQNRMPDQPVNGASAAGTAENSGALPFTSNWGTDMPKHQVFTQTAGAKQTSSDIALTNDQDRIHAWLEEKVPNFDPPTTDMLAGVPSDLGLRISKPPQKYLEARSPDFQARTSLVDNPMIPRVDLYQKLLDTYESEKARWVQYKIDARPTDNSEQSELDAYDMLLQTYAPVVDANLEALWTLLVVRGQYHRVQSYLDYVDIDSASEILQQAKENLRARVSLSIDNTEDMYPVVMAP